MTPKRTFSERIGEGVLALLCVSALLLGLFSWLAHAAGYSVNSLLSGEGMRKLFLRENGTNCMADGMRGLLLLLLALGAWQYSGLGEACARWRTLTLRQRRALLSAGTVLAVGCALCVLSPLFPGFPLLSITGQLFPSPFSQGLPVMLVLVVMGAAAVYGSVSKHLCGWAQGLRLTYIGIRLHAVWLFDYLMLRLLLVGMKYVFEG